MHNTSMVKIATGPKVDMMSRDSVLREREEEGLKALRKLQKIVTSSPG